LACICEWGAARISNARWVAVGRSAGRYTCGVWYIRVPALLRCALRGLAVADGRRAGAGAGRPGLEKRVCGERKDWGARHGGSVSAAECGGARRGKIRAEGGCGRWTVRAPAHLRRALRGPVGRSAGAGAGGPIAGSSGRRAGLLFLRGRLSRRRFVFGALPPPLPAEHLHGRVRV
jgi:hypothetical protein